MKNTLLLLLLFISFMMQAQGLQKVSSGKIEHIENFQSNYTSARNIDIWLPESYDGIKKFAVLYMHDGQMLFDSTATWNHQSWDVDDIAGRLIKVNKLQDFIVVGIWSVGAKRHTDFFPQKPFENLSKTEKDSAIRQLQSLLNTKEVFQPNSDKYLKFMVAELKPLIDNKYVVYTDCKHTLIAGSSMGGLISMYAICEYPLVFGGAACLSTHWPGSFAITNNPIPDAFLNYLKSNLPSPENHRIYFDCGDQTLDALYPPIQKKADSIMHLKGFSDKNWLTKYFPGKNHTEKAWKERFDMPLLFLLGK